jgi:predicted transcriptional regulator
MKVQQEVEQDARIDMAMLRRKEIEEAQQREIDRKKAIEALLNKQRIQEQMHDKEMLRLMAQQEEFEREKGQVTDVVNKLIEEDHEMMRLTRMKQDQAKLDMRQSVLEKKRQEQYMRDLNQQEEENVRRYAQEQASREAAIRREKAKVEAEREKIFEQLRIEEEARRADEEYIERLRVELYQE